MRLHWQYIARENLELPPIYYSHKREVVRRKGLLVPVTPLTPKLPNEVSEVLDVRFRTVGDISCTCPVASTASTPLEIIEETAIADISERSATRLDDRASEAAMEKRKKKGIFSISTFLLVQESSKEHTIQSMLLFDFVSVFLTKNLQTRYARTVQIF